MDSLDTQSATSSTPSGNLRSASAAAISAMSEEYSNLMPYLTYSERIELEKLLSGVEVPLWEPFPGPQTEALSSLADELFYGGAAGGGKTDLLLGTALTRHSSSLIFRREYAELKGINERSWELFDDIGKFNAQQQIWRLLRGKYKGKRIEFGACQFEGDERKFQGRPHDFLGFDEITQFLESQYRFLSAWNRTVLRGQRVRVVCAGNPPVNEQGRWIVKYWAPWLDPSYSRPAKQGELRWFVTGTDGSDQEVDGPSPVEVKMIDGSIELIYPKSRTFIRARVEDNPRLMESGYRRTLQNLPEPLRSRMLRGDFAVGNEDAEWQVIPTDWVLQAQARWAPTYELYIEKMHRVRQEQALKANTDYPAENDLDTSLRPFTVTLTTGPSTGGGDNNFNEPPKVQMPNIGGSGIDLTALIGARSTSSSSPSPSPNPRSNTGVGIPRSLTKAEIASMKLLALESSAVGVDVSRGGKDDTIISDRVGSWFDTLICIPGRQTTDGSQVIQTLINFGLVRRRIQIDVTGVGTSPVDLGKMYEMNIVPMVMSGKSNAKERSGKLGFISLRAEWWWKFREALDPSFGSDIALPPDPDLLADLTSPRWSLSIRGIQVEDKKFIKDRLGRSPDKGDAVVLAYAVPHQIAEDFLKYVKEQSEAVKEALALESESRGQNRGRNELRF